MKTCIRFLFVVLIGLSVLVPCFSQDSSEEPKRLVFGMSVDESIAVIKRVFSDATEFRLDKFGIFYAGPSLYISNDDSFKVLRLDYPRIVNPVEEASYSNANVEVFSASLPMSTDIRKIMDASHKRCDALFIDGKLVAYRTYSSLSLAVQMASTYTRSFGPPVVSMTMNVRGIPLYAWALEHQVLTCITDTDSNVFTSDAVSKDFFLNSSSYFSE
jgi:hypothetical protein